MYKIVFYKNRKVFMEIAYFLTYRDALTWALFYQPPKTKFKIKIDKTDNTVYNLSKGKGV